MTLHKWDKNGNKLICTCGDTRPVNIPSPKKDENGVQWGVHTDKYCHINGKVIYWVGKHWYERGQILK